MIDSLKIVVEFDRPELLKGIDNISFGAEADIQIFDHPTNGDGLKTNKYNIGYCPTQECVNLFNEAWVRSERHERLLGKNTRVPIFVLTEDESLLPYCMKDRLAYLQDKINKEKGRYGRP